MGSEWRLWSLLSRPAKHCGLYFSRKSWSICQWDLPGRFLADSELCRKHWERVISSQKKKSIPLSSQGSNTRDEETVSAVVLREKTKRRWEGGHLLQWFPLLGMSISYTRVPRIKPRLCSQSHLLLMCTMRGSRWCWSPRVSATHMQRPRWSS